MAISLLHATALGFSKIFPSNSSVVHQIREERCITLLLPNPIRSSKDNFPVDKQGGQSVEPFYRETTATVDGLCRFLIFHYWRRQRDCLYTIVERSKSRCILKDGLVGLCHGKLIEISVPDRPRKEISGWLSLRFNARNVESSMREWDMAKKALSET